MILRVPGRELPAEVMWWNLTSPRFFSQYLSPFRNSECVNWHCLIRQLICLMDRAPSSGIRAVGQIHREQYQHLAFSILFSVIQTTPQKIYSEL